MAEFTAARSTPQSQHFLGPELPTLKCPHGAGGLHSPVSSGACPAHTSSWPAGCRPRLQRRANPSGHTSVTWSTVTVRTIYVFKWVNLKETINRATVWTFRVEEVCSCEIGHKSGPSRCLAEPAVNGLTRSRKGLQSNSKAI